MVIAGMVFGELPKLSRTEVLYFNPWVLRPLLSMASSLSLFDHNAHCPVQDMPENTKTEKYSSIATAVSDMRFSQRCLNILVIRMGQAFYVLGEKEKSAHIRIPGVTLEEKTAAHVLS